MASIKIATYSGRRSPLVVYNAQRAESMVNVDMEKVS
jgi:hypothetical protein